MSKKFLIRLLVGLSFLAAAVLFLLSELMPEKFGGFNLSWAGVIFAGVCGLCFLLGGLTAKNSTQLSRHTLPSGSGCATRTRSSSTSKRT